MKKFITFLIFMLIFSNTRSQCIAAGPGLVNIVGGDGHKNRVGFQASVEPKILTVGNGGITAGAGISMQGSKWEDSYGGTTYKGKTNLTYIIIPILYQIMLARSIYGEIGAQPMILMSAKDKTDGQSQSDDIKKYINTFNLALPIGVGYRSSGGFGAGIRFSYGLLGLNKDKQAGDKTERAMMLTALLSYQLSALNLSGDKGKK